MRLQARLQRRLSRKGGTSLNKTDPDRGDHWIQNPRGRGARRSLEGEKPQADEDPSPGNDLAITR